MPGTQTIWQVLRCATPFTVARHSMQIPIPHNGPLASPVTENRHGSWDIIIAAATLVPSATRTRLPFTVMKNPSSLNLNASSKTPSVFPVPPIIAYNFVYQHTHRVAL